MKAVNKLAVLLSLGSLVPFAASAKTPEQAYIDANRPVSGVPVPIAVVSPHVSQDYVGATVEIEFIVDRNGQSSGFSVKSSPDSALAQEVVAAVKQWQFAPAQRDGATVATRVVLPVHIIDGTQANYAAN
jgi:TonB family protein